MARQVTVVVMDDHPFYRDGLSRGLTLDGRVKVVGEAGGGREGLEIIGKQDPDGWDEQTRTPHDELLYSAAREFLSNVTRHAHAHSARVALQRGEGRIRFIVSDDGTGLPDGVLADKLAKGHIGIAAQRVRIEAAGGRFSLRSGHPGILAEVEPADHP